MKTCIDCKEEKELNEFHKKAQSKDGRQYRCKECNRAKAKNWQAENAERHESYWKARDANVEWRVGSQFKKRAKKYGLTPEQLQEMLDEAAGVCDLCKRPPNHFLVVDHCHNSLKVRGILCEPCNQALGLLRDDISVIQRAVSYLQKDN